LLGMSHLPQGQPQTPLEHDNTTNGTNHTLIITSFHHVV
jgi:hypothetical protein